MGRAFKALYTLVLLSLLMVVLYSYVNPTPALNDTLEYQHAANNLLVNNILYSGSLSESVDFRLYSKRTLGYPIFLVFQLQNSSLVLLVSLSLYALIFILGLQILSNFSKQRAVLVSYCILFLLHIALTIHVTWLMADLLVTACITAIVAIFYLKNTNLRSKVSSISLLWGVCLLLKPVFLPTLILIPILFFYLKHKARNWFLMLWLPLVVFLTGSYVNYTNSGVFEYSSISTINLGQYNTKLMVANADGVEAANSFTNTTTFDVPRSKIDYLSYKKKVKDASLLAISENPLAYAKVHLAGMVKMLLDPGRFEIYTFLKLNDHNLSLTELVYGGNWQLIKDVMTKNKGALGLFLLLLLVNIVKLLLSLFSLKKTSTFAFIALLILYFIGITGPVGAARFMLPVSILYIVLACIGLGELLALFQKRSKS